MSDMTAPTIDILSSTPCPDDLTTSTCSSRYWKASFAVQDTGMGKHSNSFQIFNQIEFWKLKNFQLL